MTKFHLDANNLFMDGEGGQITVWRVENRKLNEPALFTGDWTRVTILNPNSDQLEIFGHIIRGFELNQLAQELKKCGWAINREGYIYMYLFVPGTSMSFRINDLFCWSKYNVHPTRTTVWNKLEMETQKTIVDLREKDRLLEEYKGKLHELEKELSLCKDQSEEKDKSLTEYQQKLSEKEKELLDLKGRFAREEERLDAVEKELSYDAENLKKKSKELEEVEIELSSSKKRLEEKEQELSKVEFRLVQREEEINLMEKELSAALKKIEEKKLEMKYVVSFFIILIFVLLLWEK